MALLADRKSDLLIDGKLVAGSAGTFPTVNPASEEVLGVAADADPQDMGRAIEAARRAFDETDWSTNTGLRVRCLRQLQDALREHVEELREITIAEVGTPRMLTAAAQLEGPIDDLGFCRRHRGVLRVANRSRRRVADGHPHPPHHRAGSRRRGRRHYAVEFPASDQPRQAGPRAGGRQYRRPQTGAGHTVVCRGGRPDHRRAHRVPAGCGQHRHLQRPRCRRATVERPTGGHGFVHRLDGHRPQRDGRCGGNHQEGVPRTGRQVGVPGARRRGPGRGLLDGGVHRGDARRAGLRDHHPPGGAPRPLRRGRRGGRGHHVRAQAGRPDRQAAPSAAR